MSGLRCVVLLSWMLVAGCGGGGGSGGGKPAPTYSISGVVTRVFDGSPTGGVSVSLTGPAGTVVAATSTDSNGNYAFAGLAPGDYVVAATSPNLTVTPGALAVTIAAADVNGQNFLDFQVEQVASGLDLQTGTSSGYQLRVTLVVNGDNLYLTDVSDEPLKRISLSDGSTTPLASKIGYPENVFLHGGEAFWVDGGKLNRTALDGSQTTVFANGDRDVATNVTADVLFDSANAYWVNTVPSIGCNGHCTPIIQRAPLDGGSPVTLATGDRTIVAIASDADNIYWEEDSMEPTSPGCQCGSTIKKVSKNGGTPVVLVDGTLNGTLPSPGPGYIPGSWFPTGGIAVDATNVYFGVSEIAYRIVAVPVGGGALTTLASAPNNTSSALDSILRITVDASNVYWIDSSSRSVDSLPVAGGSVTSLASGLEIGTLQQPAPTLVITADAAYWSEPDTTSDCCRPMGTGRIRQVSLAGGAPTTVIDRLDSPTGFALDGTNIVVAEAWRIARAPLGGGAAATIASGITTDMARFAIDQTAIYVLDGPYVKTVPLGGGRVEKLAAASGPNLQTLGIANLDIATDGSAVYWTTASMGSSGQLQLWKSPTVGGAPVVLAQDAAPDPTQCYWRIALDAQNVYFSASSSQQGVLTCGVRQVPKAGGVANSLVDMDGVRDFTIDATNLYFSVSDSQHAYIGKMPLAGGATTGTSADAWVLTNTGGRLYWIDPQETAIVTVSKSGPDAAMSLVAPISTDLVNLMEYVRDSIVGDPSGVYWSEARDGNVFVLR
ncbi:MAG TPA: carboxypeptidase regulatory-like domain-containing protein [Pseudomonadales bacterium]|nr:carboxypeptidase regulatory-like domain-containing protein [Pseudomonadales bacterium]